MAVLRCCHPGRSILRAVRRGILGGTFDPPHLAHLVAGEAAYHQLGLDVVTFVPAGAPWQKADRGVTPAADRWAMTLAAIEGVGHFAADDREIHRDGWTYTIDTLETFSTEDELVLILGADAALGLPTWRSWEGILARAHLAIAARPGVDREQVDAVLSDAAVTWLQVPELAISATELRTMQAAGSSIRFLVPDGVYRYIRENGLYGLD